MDLWGLLGAGGIAATGAVGLLSTLCFCAVPVVIVGVVFYFLRQSGKQMEAREKAAQSWPSTQGRILKSRVQTSGGENATTYPYVLYEYEVGGQRYESEAIGANGSYTQLRTLNEYYDFIDSHPVGKEVTVYYDPARPSEACLVR